jgi:hypothetical protein
MTKTTPTLRTHLRDLWRAMPDADDTAYAIGVLAAWIAAPIVIPTVAVYRWNRDRVVAGLSPRVLPLTVSTVALAGIVIALYLTRG